MYQTDLKETERQYITKVLNLQERKRKYDLCEIGMRSSIWWKLAVNGVCFLGILLLGSWFTIIIANGALWVILIYCWVAWEKKCVLKWAKKQNRVWVLWIVKVYVREIITLSRVSMGNKKIKGDKRHVVVGKKDLCKSFFWFGCMPIIVNNLHA